jgi:hypothetical protein
VEGVTAMVKSVTLKVTAAVCTSVPFVPVMVSVELAAGVLPEVVTVSVDVLVVPVMVAGLKLAVAPAGNPVTLKARFPVSPLTAVAVTVYVALPPTITVCVDGVAVKVKFLTPSVACAVLTTDPLVPVTVNAVLPPGVAAVVETVSVEVPDAPGIVTGLNEPDAPAGSPLMLSVTVPVNPPSGDTVTV